MKPYSLILLACLLFSCASHENNKLPVESPGYRKYQIKSGSFENETVLSTVSVHMAYKTKIYFDDYGMKECRDSYSGDTLEERFMCDGINTYKLIPKLKTAYMVGKAYRGTEPRFSWADVDQTDKKSGKAKKLADTTIAGERCEQYKVSAEGVTATYAGYKNISFLTMIISPGGTSLTRCLSIENKNIAPEFFSIPEGYITK